MQFPAVVVVRLVGVRHRRRCSGQWLFQFLPRLRERTKRDADLACKRGEGNPAYPHCVCSSRWRRGCGGDLHTVVPDVPGAELHVEFVFIPLRLQDQPLDFAGKLSPFAALWCLTYGCPEVAVPSLGLLSRNHFGFTNVPKAVPDSASEGTLVFPRTGGDRNDRESTA